MQLQTPTDTEDHPIKSLELRSILLVDDDKQLASALQWILADENFLVDVAHDGDEAILKVNTNPYDLVICDVMMPRIRGDEFYFKSLEVDPDLRRRFIFITGFAAEPRIGEFLTSQNLKYLVKPFPVQRLIKSVTEQMARIHR